MGVITKPYTFSPNTTIESAQVNSDLDTLFNEFNGNIDNANIKSSAAIVESKLAFNTSTGHSHNGIDSRLLSNVQDRSIAPITVTTTIVETEIYSFSVPASTLSTNKLLRLNMLFTYFNTSGSNQDLTIKLKYGATTIAQATRTLASSASTWTFRYTFEILANNSVTAQLGSFIGVGRLPESTSTDAANGSAAENSALVKTLSVTIQHGLANATISFSKLWGILELL